ncbi:2'-5' RNA ligase family protein [Listeria costaricensis]|uniref:2'-5' RNA ligase family protein n=1 Tax=Listeria costaricensis TaxID=2026604 RepID=UPI000C06960A|nr:2'-5' RNA ligase family protein [Listeria costaricensis]
MYAVVAIFDEHLNQKIIRIWRKLEETGVSDYFDRMKLRLPHITIASYGELDVPNFIQEMRSFYQDRLAFTVSFASFGSFIETRAVYLAPVMTSELYLLHLDHSRHFKEWSGNPHVHYLPGEWVPHTTIASHLARRAQIRVFEYLVHSSPRLSGRVTGLALIRLEGDNAEILAIKRFKPQAD